MSLRFNAPLFQPGSADILVLIETARKVSKLISEETQHLARFQATDLRGNNRRKQQGLVDLDRALRGLRGRPLPPEADKAIGDLRRELDDNLHVLSLHLSAMSEVADLIADVIRRAESDGTYGPRGKSGSPAR